MMLCGSGSRNILALLSLILGTYVLSNRYLTSAAFERPLHLSFSVFLVSGILLVTSRRYINKDHRREPLDIFNIPPKDGIRPYPYHPEPGRLHASYLFKYGSDKIKNLRLLFLLLLCSLVLRTALYWYITRTAQCSWRGLEVFLPFFVFTFDLISSSTTLSLGSGFDESLQSPAHSKGTLSKLAYGVFSLAWAFSAASALSSIHMPTGTVCPSFGQQWHILIPGAQIACCVADAAIIVCFSRLGRREMEEDLDISKFTATLFFSAAACTLFLAIPWWSVDRNFFWLFHLHWTDLRDLAVDSFIVVIVLFSGLSLAVVLHPTTIALAITSLGYFGLYIPRYELAPLLLPLCGREVLQKISAAAVLTGPLWYLAIYPQNNPRPSATDMLHRWLLLCYIGAVGLCIAFAAFASEPPIQLSMHTAIDILVTAARGESEKWLARAATSTTLADAVTQYQLQYQIPPPPNFDKWVEFAMENGSPIMDTFDQINEDLLPFWGLKPSVIRERIIHALQYSSHEIGGIRIRNGTIEQSPYIYPTHRWMTDSFEKMIEPFVEWLPDMILPINLADECRVAIPFEEMQILKIRAKEAREQLNQQITDKSSKSDLNSSTWWTEFPEPIGEEGKTIISSHFTDNIRKQIFYDFVAPSCPPHSLARDSRWWDWSTVCVECMAPHSVLTREGAVIANVSLASDLCHQPDIAYLSGLALSPSTMIGSNTLFPVFSQGRMGGFSDILIPSPWNFDDKSIYNEEEDLPWEEKTNSIFWRGSSSDGYAADGSWTGFLRARFVHESYQRVATSPRASLKTSLGINVSFTGDVSKCHAADCLAELDMFGLWGSVVYDNEEQRGGFESREPRPLPPATPFNEHWRFRHLMDMDGAGFSGRFLPFLNSRSLVYRAALFRTWYDERLQPWLHYVPVDARLGSGFWAVVEFLAGRTRGTKGDVVDSDGEIIAMEIAEQGRKWAQRALRKQDMQIYMFRLLLEWGRVVSDARETLKFGG
ncbi:glycosyltransferase family 90 protein [Xylogone sp. PMI_703]|nr:glycosyltransferase family 90 protein [Xylogone sp. PMI_703]